MTRWLIHLHICSPSLKFTTFHSFTLQYDLDIADPSSMQDADQLWTYYLASLSMSSPYLSG